MENLSNPTARELVTPFDRQRISAIGERSYQRFNGREHECLSAKDEIEAYMRSWDAIHKSNIELLHNDIAAEPLPENLSAYVIMPVALGQETDSLRKTLSQYAKQDADPSTWSLLLYLNYTETPDSYGTFEEKLQETLNNIEEFKAENPTLSIRTISNCFSDSPPAIGTIRKDAWDVALYDVMKQDKAHDNLIGISHDADAAIISPDYISSMQRTAVSHPLKDILTCPIGWEKLGDPYSDANKVLHYWEYLSDIQHILKGKVDAWDFNTAIRLGSYAAINGFGQYVRIAEMLDLRGRLAIARGLSRHSTDHIHYLYDISLTSDARRLYQAINNGHSPDRTWSYVQFQTGEDPVRRLDTLTLASRPISRPILWHILADMDKLNLHLIDSKDRLSRIGRKALQLPL